MVVSEADKTLFVGNLDPRATEELLFELFLQAGPAVNVKIPKDKDGKPKQFAFVNFKHEESAPYGMNLLNGIKLFGRPLKIQFRSGSSHLSQDTSNTALVPQGHGNDNECSAINTSSNGSRYDNGEYYGSRSPGTSLQRSYSSPDDLQRQAVMNNFMWQHSPHGSHAPTQSGLSSSSSYLYSSHYTQNVSPQRHDFSFAQSKSRSSGSHPYLNEERYHHREACHRGNMEDYYNERRVESTSRERRNESRWRSSRY
ncbi:RNA-binding protein 7 [Spea bombifrons]|uniref:RNA-binding protein 7 n=1 Tax=Spea bombifrons TaxID=233779 RepID=UPI00234BC714|nr:RNA-binding protein 7 [Spea bombifrons]